MRFIHVSDLHVMQAGARLYGIDPAQRLRTCINDINRFVGTSSAPSFCVFTGDLVESGDPDAYHQLRVLLAELQLPYYLMLGNHDARDAFFDVFKQYQRDANGFLQYCVPTAVGTFVFLDTLNQGQAAGLLCDVRLDWLRQQLALHAGKPAYLFTHHPLVDLQMPCLDRVALQNPDRLLDCVASFDVRHLFFGHVHRAVSGHWHGIGLSGVPSCVHQIGSDFVSTDVMRYEHGPPAYAFVDVSDSGVLTQLQHFLPVHQTPGFQVGESVSN